ncbi:2Fe-2S iron-sulfur cluster binding domain-containing protein [Bradyrhizobium manausense]|uniref:2Fe-2S iron-sulfur cluster-binding protein n=1 Tax=Bradyrhizobium manausense TaxID=989370 RepID=UPI001BAAD22B|nr:2Fe-2S iron-sulfur cluster-binding protein [Bradyrhizobium manausense]MBR0828583.1 2Fe-2S iron-sulfur cluster binding domain-containing protein [Bradyrhizobium manausense]
MTKLLVIAPGGSRRQIEAVADVTIMENIRNAGITELAALCGGCRSCATCHVYVEVERPDLLPPISDEENDLLDASDHRQSNSRLSCQITVTAEMGTISVEIAPET